MFVRVRVCACACVECSITRYEQHFPNQNNQPNTPDVVTPLHKVSTETSNPQRVNQSASTETSNPQPLLCALLAGQSSVSVVSVTLHDRHWSKFSRIFFDGGMGLLSTGVTVLEVWKHSTQVLKAFLAKSRGMPPAQKSEHSILIFLPLIMVGHRWPL